jgi:hypothetical protein
VERVVAMVTREADARLTETGDDTTRHEVDPPSTRVRAAIRDTRTARAHADAKVKQVHS